MTDANPKVEGDVKVITPRVGTHQWISSDTVPLLYINHAEINAGLADFTMRIGMVENIQVTENKVIARETAKIVMSPQQAKLVAAALAHVIQEYEKLLGPISVAPIR